MDIDTRVAQAVMAVKLLERALHDVGPWFFVINGYAVHADRKVTDDGVSFTATAPFSTEWATAVLARGNEHLSVRDIGPVEAGVTITWSLAASVALT